MLNVILTVHMIACLALVIAVMLQRSEGGALGMSGGGTGGIISGRGAASALVRITMFLAGLFFITSIVMTNMNNSAANQKSVLERQTEQSADPFDTLRNTPATTTPGAPVTTTPASDPATTPGVTTPAPSGAAPAPAPATTPDPLAPSKPATTQSTAPAATAPAATTPAKTATAPAPAATTPATTAPTTPAPTPENGGSPN